MLKVTPEIYNKALELGYPEEFVEIESISIPSNDTAEDIELWLLKEKDLLCRPFPHGKNSFSIEIRKLNKTTTVTVFYSHSPKFKTYEEARIQSINYALKLIS